MLLNRFSCSVLVSWFPTCVRICVRACLRVLRAAIIETINEWGWPANVAVQCLICFSALRSLGLQLCACFLQKGA